MRNKLIRARTVRQCSNNVADRQNGGVIINKQFCAHLFKVFAVRPSLSLMEERSDPSSAGTLSAGVSYDFEDGPESLDMSEMDERLGLLSGRRARWFNGPRWQQVRAVLTPEVIKTIIITAVFLAAIVLFARMPESDETTRLYAVSATAPWSYLVDPSPTALQIDLELQSATASQLDLLGQTILVRVFSGGNCPSNVTSPCTMVASVIKGQRSVSSKTFALDRSGATWVNVTTLSPEPLALSIKVIELGYAVGWEVLIAAIVLIGVYGLIIFVIQFNLLFYLCFRPSN